MVEGFIIFPRWMYSDGVLNGDRDYWSVWSYLMFNVNYFDTQVIIKNEVLTVHKDQIFTTRRKISEAIGVSETKVDKALKLFEKVGYIKMKSDRRGRLISLTFEELRTKPHTTPSQENVNYCTDAVQPTDNQECCNADGETPHSNAEFGGFETETKPKQNQNKAETKPKQNQNAHTKEINKEINKGNKRNKDILSSNLNTVKSVVDYLNEKCGTKYKHSSTETQRLIVARLNQGFSLEDFKQVIDNKVADWGNDSQMSKFLRPQTLFSNKFESYLNQSVAVQNKSVDSWRDSSFNIEDVSGFHPLPGF